MPGVQRGSALPVQSTPARFKARKVGLVINDPSLGAGLEPAASSPLCFAGLGR